MFLCQREEIFGNFPELCFFMLIDVVLFLLCKSINEESPSSPGIQDDCAVATGFSLSSPETMTGDKDKEEIKQLQEEGDEYDAPAFLRRKRG